VFDPKTLLDRGREFARSRRPEEACDLFAQAVAEARFLHNPLLLVEALMALGQIECSLRHPATAADCYHEAALVAAHNAEPALQAEALIELAGTYLSQERTGDAARVCDELLAVTQKAEDGAALARARALHMLARIQESAVHHDELALLLQAAATLYEMAGDSTHAAECKSHLAFLLGQ